MTFTDRFTKLSFPNLGLVRFPQVVISPEDRAELGVKPDASNRDVLRTAAWLGYKTLAAKGRFLDITEQQVIDRFRMELGVLDSTGVIDYLLLVWDINRWCDKQGIVRGYGRGSAGGSLFLYALGVTRVNPIKHNLDFRRFISEARMRPVIKDGVVYVEGKTAPDVDSDYEYLRRDDVVRYIASRFPGRTAKISTRLDLTGKMALKNVLKVYLGWHDDQAQAVSDLVEVKYGKVRSLYDTRHGYKEDGKDVPPNANMVEWIAAHAKHQEAYDIAMAIEGSPVARGQHPSGVAISYDLLDGNVPLELSKDGEATTTYDMETIAGILTKLDILGLRTLDLVAGTAALAGVKVDDIDVEDPSIYHDLPTHDRYLGLFQIADGLTKQASRKIGPRNVDELASILAISRPGALTGIDQFAAYVKTGEIKSLYPPIDEIMKTTGGVLIMQEQITRVCHEVFGLTQIEASEVEYGIRKKKREEVAKWETIIRERGKQRGVPESVISQFWSTCNASANYSFCQCLSPDTVVETPDGDRMLYQIRPGDKVKAYDVANGCDHLVTVEAVHPGETEVYEVELEDGRRIVASLDHRFLCEDRQMHTLNDIILKGLRVLTD